jgi:copper oxidase (laccase) domain-containing protein
MDAGMMLLAALGPALAKALYEVGKEVVVKPLMGCPIYQFPNLPVYPHRLSGGLCCGREVF